MPQLTAATPAGTSRCRPAFLRRWTVMALSGLLAGATACSVTETTAPVNRSAPGEPTKLTVSVPTVQLGAVGASAQLTAELTDARGRVVPKASLVWLSSDFTIADVSASGGVAIITGRSTGRTTIRVSAGALFADIPVTVKGARAISVAPAAATMRAGDTFRFQPTVDADSGTSPELRWSTDNAAVATVASDGTVTGLTPGSTSVRVTVLGDPRLAAVALVTVTSARSVRIQPESLTTWVGDRATLRAVVDVDSAQARTVTWSSADPGIATVSNSGELVAIGVGTVQVRATSVADPRAKDSVRITVRPERRVEIAPATVTMGAGQTRALTATVSIESGLSRAVTWRSSNAAVAMISSDGLVTGVAQGSAQITAIAVADTTRRATATVQIVPIARDLDVQPAAATVFLGDEAQLLATVAVDSGGTRAVAWRSSNPSVATVSATGLVRGVAAGTAIITALSLQDTTVRATSLITVRNAVVVSLSPSTLTINPSDVRTLAASVQADAGVSTAVTWRSENPAVATVDASGRVTGVAAGTTGIVALAVADTTRRGRTIVNVIPAVRTVSIAPAALTLAPTEARTLMATVTGDPGVSSAVIWRTSDSTVVAVSGTGVATGVGVGAATITAIAAGDTTKRATVAVTVQIAPIVAISPSGSFSLTSGQTLALSASVVASASVPTTIGWSSSNASVVTVTSNGLVTAVGIGAATITASLVADPSRQASVTVTVIPQVLSVSVSPSAAALAIGGSLPLTATVAVEGTLSTAVTWRSSNPAVASVNFAGTVSAIAAGSATITAISTADTTKRATAAVSVFTAPSRMAASWSTTRLSGGLYEDVVSIDGIDASTAFAVNAVGNVYRWNGTAWSLSATGSSYGTRFLAVHASSSSHVIAVGTNGVIARFNGSAWSTMSSGVTASLNGVWVESASSAFAVGASGTALRYNGSSWSATTSGSTQTLNGVWSTGGTAFAVGTSGEILRWNGSVWVRATPVTGETLYGVSGSTTSDVVAVGTFGTILRFNGSTWSRVTTSVTSDLYSVVAGTPAYIASDDGVLQLSGSSVTPVTTPYAPRMFSVNVDGAGALWAGGQRGLAMRQAGSWTTTNLAPDLIDVWSVNSTRAWAVGEFGSIYQWNGSSWTRQAAPATATLNTVWAASATDAFAGGDNGTMLYWNGSTWTTQAFPVTSAIYGVWGTSATNVYAVTAGGQIVRFNGTSWNAVASAPGALWAVHGSSANDIVATGENGAAMRYNGSQWLSLGAPTSGTLAGVFAVGPSSYLSVGANSTGTSGIAFIGNSTGWTAASTGSTSVLTSIWGPSATDIYATGDAGTILRFNGSSWSAMATGTTDLFWSVASASDGTAGFAVGYNSTIATATPGTGLVAGLRSSGSLPAAGRTLDPQRGARVVRGALPTGASRKQRSTR